MITWDIETGPLPEPELLAIYESCEPFEAPPHPGIFDPATVKHGNTKDPAKRAQKEAEEEAKHLNAVAAYDQMCADAKAKHWVDFVGKAALSAVTGRVLAIGVWNPDPTENGDKLFNALREPHLFFDKESGEPQHDGEVSILQRFWGLYNRVRKSNESLVGCNIFDFDLPFLIRRSWILGVDVPATVVVSRRYFDPVFVDLREIWLCGQRGGNGGERSSLDAISRALGAGNKPDGIGGADFSRLWFGTPEERGQAVEYLKNDLRMTAGAAVRMGL